MQSRDNVTDIAHRVSPFPQQSQLYFRVVERDDGWMDKNGQWHKDPSLKKLLRQDDDGNPHVLSTVGRKYKVINNDELFPYIESHMQKRLDPHLLRDVKVRDEWSHDGRDCYREYVFPNLRCDIDGGGDIAFRLIVGNSYGGKAVQLITGAIDFFCTNGMIVGMHEKVVRKHTSGVTVNGLERWISDSVTYFTKHKERMQEWSHTQIDRTREDPMFKHLVDKSIMSERHAAQIGIDMHEERNARVGRDNRPTLWHFYSALTAWASHGDVRNTGNDHVANTRIDRQRHAMRATVAAEGFLKAA